jgi:hypothetical protein
MRPPTNEPAIPNKAVAKQPIGSRPGINSLAIPPTISPIINQPMMEKIIGARSWEEIGDRITSRSPEYIVYKVARATRIGVIIIN